MSRIINVLGMIPDEIIRKANAFYRNLFFDEFPVTEGGQRWIEYRVKVYKAPPAKAAMAVRDLSTLCEVLEHMDHGLTCHAVVQFSARSHRSR